MVKAPGEVGTGTLATPVADPVQVGEAWIHVVVVPGVGKEILCSERLLEVVSKRTSGDSNNPPARFRKVLTGVAMPLNRGECWATTPWATPKIEI